MRGPVDSGEPVIVDAQELRSLATAARSARSAADHAVARIGAVLSTVDRRGWNAGAADNTWSGARAGLRQLEADLEQHAAILDERANLVDRFETVQPGDGVPWGPSDDTFMAADMSAFAIISLDPGLRERLARLTDEGLAALLAQLPEEVRTQLEAALSSLGPFLAEVGGSVVDFVDGFLAEYAYVNNWWAPIDMRDQVKARPGESAATTLGRLGADTAVLIQSGGEIVQGTNIVTGGVGLCLATLEVGGEGCLAVAPATAVGGALVAAGAVTAVEATRSWNANLGIWQARLRTAPAGEDPHRVELGTDLTDPDHPVYRASEADAGQHLEQTLGQTIERHSESKYPDKYGDWVGPDGKSYDAVGPLPDWTYFNLDSLRSTAIKVPIIFSST